jgi:lipopolysaccharide transport system permease protein
MEYTKHSGSSLGIYASLVRHRHLIWQMTKREVIGRYRGSMLGLMWSCFHTLLMLAVYTFVFYVVLKARWGIHGDSKAEFAMLLFTGLIVYYVFAECTNRAPNLIVGNVNYVKKVVFPLEILPLVSLGSALFHAAVSVMVLLLFYGLVHMSLHWTVILFPILLVPLVLFILGLSWFLASTGVYLRDAGQAIGILTTLVLFLAPVFYPISAIPEMYRPFVYMNPLTLIVEQARDVLIWGKQPQWSHLGIYLLCSILFAWLGFSWFQKTRKGFADVL